MGLVRFSKVEVEQPLLDPVTGEVVLISTSYVWVETAVVSAVTAFLFYTGNHEIASIRRAVHIVKDYNGHEAVARSFNVDDA
jgi:hypothetical protein